MNLKYLVEFIIKNIDSVRMFTRHSHYVSINNPLCLSYFWINRFVPVNTLVRKRTLRTGESLQDELEMNIMLEEIDEVRNEGFGMVCDLEMILSEIDDVRNESIQMDDELDMMLKEIDSSRRIELNELND